MTNNINTKTNQENFNNNNQEPFDTFFKRERDLFCYRVNANKIHQKLTSAELSKKANISPFELEQYLIGTCDFKFGKMCQIANALDVSIEDLFQN